MRNTFEDRQPAPADQLVAPSIALRCASIERSIEAHRATYAIEDEIVALGEEVKLWAFREQLHIDFDKRQNSINWLAELPAKSPDDLVAKARLLLRVLDEMDPAPGLDLARSIARDVLAMRS